MHATRLYEHNSVISVVMQVSASGLDAKGIAICKIAFHVTDETLCFAVVSGMLKYSVESISITLFHKTMCVTIRVGN